MRSKAIQQVLIVSILGLLAFELASVGADAAEPSFEKLHLLPSYWSEGANVADLNKDGHMDIICGPHWFKGPNFKERFEFYPAVAPTKRSRNDFAVYSLDNFFSFVHDCNGDGRIDVLTVGLPGTTAYWYENPRDHSKTARENPPHWKRHFVMTEQTRLANTASWVVKRRRALTESHSRSYTH